MKKGVEFLDFLFVLRPMLFYPIWTFFLAGLWAAERYGNSGETYNSLIVIISLTLVIGAVFILNQVRDKVTDRINNKLFLIANDIVTEKQAFAETILLSFAGLSVIVFVSFKIFAIFIVLFVLSGWAYNFPPLRWKDRPIMGMVTNSLSGLFIYSAGWITGGGTGIVPVQVIPYALAGAAVYLNTTLPDMKGDRAADKMTFSVKYGISACIRAAAFIEILSVILAFVFSDWILFFAGLVVLPLFLYSAVKPGLRSAVMAIKFSVVALLAGVCIFYPFLLAAVFVSFIITKWYYKKRFNFNYPNLKANNGR
ncbi:UbiA family prenyltransferase [bacterium]|nr:UbiA family prenyltransferase [bacterium]